MENIVAPVPSDSTYKYRPQETARTETKQISEETTNLPRIVPAAEIRIDVHPQEGYFLVYHPDYKYPSKGLPSPLDLRAVNITKRAIMEQLRLVTRPILLPFTALVLATPWLNRKAIAYALEGFKAFGHLVLSSHIPDDEFWLPCPKELRIPIRVFLEQMKFVKEGGAYLAELLAIPFHHDKAYRYRLEDLASETTKEKLLAHPRAEVLRILDLWQARESVWRDRADVESMKAKIKALRAIASVVMLLPQVRKAFRKAVEATDLTKMQFDEADHYHVLPFAGYDFFGQTIYERFPQWIKIHDGKIPGKALLGVYDVKEVPA